MTGAHPLSSLPSLPTPDEMRRWDSAAIALGLPEMLLMENAARAALCVLEKEAAPLPGKRVLLFMGSGNNGGDAACLARHLLDAGARVLVLHTRPLRSSRGATRQHVRVAQACGVPFLRLPAAPRAFLARLDAPWRHPDIIVDGLLGTGFAGELRPPLPALIEHINEYSGPAAGNAAFILALDIPSGLNALTGRPAPVRETAPSAPAPVPMAAPSTRSEARRTPTPQPAPTSAVRATATVSFAAAKPGLVLPHARPYVGALHVRHIGIPTCVQTQTPPSFRLLDASCAALLPSPPPESYKNAFGHVLVMGGAKGLTGAAHLAARAALRCGAGLVSAAAPAALAAEVKAGLPDIMTVPLGSGSHWPAVPAPPQPPRTPSPAVSEPIGFEPTGCGDAVAPGIAAQILPDNLHAALARATALVLGPGMGQSPAAAALLEQVLALPGRPAAVLDADALNILASRPALLPLLRPHDILTPHPGEAARLLGVSAAAVQADRPTALRRLAALAPCVWVLKGAGALLCAGEGPIIVAPYDVPNLAVAGSGDVLSGCAGALLARAPDSITAAALAVALHVRAGSITQQRFPARGNTASDLAEALPLALATLDALGRADGPGSLHCSYSPGSSEAAAVQNSLDPRSAVRRA